jgi:hypothetical protein
MQTKAQERRTQLMIRRFGVLRTQLIDPILASEPPDTEIYQQIAKLPDLIDAVITEYTKRR